MTPAQEIQLFSTLERLERNTTLAIRGLQLMCTEMGIRRELNVVMNEIDQAAAEAANRVTSRESSERDVSSDSERDGSPTHVTMPAPPMPDDDEVRHGQ